jgi:hypothetical protein
MYLSVPIIDVTIQSWGGTVARRQKERSYTETTVVFVIVVVILTPLWDSSYPICRPARRRGIQSEGQDTG